MAIRTSLALGLLLTGCAVSDGTDAAADPFASVRFLCGTWRSEKAGETNEEAWAMPAGSTMHGVNRTSREGELKSFELLCILSEGEALDYEASHGPGRSTKFRLVSATQDSVTFANPDHDFPKRIRYRRAGDSMHAIVDGGDGSSQRLEFHWQRVTDPLEHR
ncbi:MAG: DUF6265 family protein [Planctomycetota bacterium]